VTWPRYQWPRWRHGAGRCRADRIGPRHPGAVSSSVRSCRDEFERHLTRFERGDELPPGVIKMVKVYVAMKRKLNPWATRWPAATATRAWSRILPLEDMPYFEDGTTGGHGAQPPGRALAYERGPDPGDSPGRAAKGLGDQINAMIEANQAAELRKKLKSVFPRPRLSKKIDAADDADVWKWPQL
jgi:DNA-directed RNA polymerase subunit beta